MLASISASSRVDEAHSPAVGDYTGLDKPSEARYFPLYLHNGIFK